MFVRIEPSGVCERNGMVQVRFSFFLEKGNYRFKEYEDAPFHNHFIRVGPDITDSEIMDLAEAYLHEAGIKWYRDLPLDLANSPIKIPVSEAKACEVRVKTLKALKDIRKV